MSNNSLKNLENNKNSKISDYFEQKRTDKNETETVDPEIIDKILNKFNDVLNTTVQKISMLVADEVKTRLAEIQPMIEEIVKREIHKFEQQWKKEKESLSDRLNFLEAREEARLRNERKNNVVIHNLQITTDDPVQEVKQFFEDKMEFKANIIEAKPTKISDKKQVVIVKLKDAEQKKHVLRNKKKLENSGAYVTFDRTKKQRENQKLLIKHAEEEEKKGNQVQIGYYKLIINGVTRVWKEGIGLASQSEQSSPFIEKCKQTSGDQMLSLTRKGTRYK